MGYLKEMSERYPIEKHGIKRKTQKNLVLVGDSGLLHKSGDLIDLHVFLTKNSIHVRLIPIVTNAMRISGLFPGSFALVDRSLRPKENSIVMVRYNGFEIIRHLRKSAGLWRLVADDPRIEEIIIGEHDTVENLGTVTSSIITLHDFYRFTENRR